MKRIIASGIAVLAFGAFLAYQPVAGGLTHAPQFPSEENSLTSTPTPTLVPTPTPVGESNAPKALTTTRPEISGGVGSDEQEYEEDDDDEYGEREHHSEEHSEYNDDDEFDSDDD